jgi:hypothetical protein
MMNIINNNKLYAALRPLRDLKDTQKGNDNTCKIVSERKGSFKIIDGLKRYFKKDK